MRNLIRERVDGFMDALAEVDDDSVEGFLDFYFDNIDRDFNISDRMDFYSAVNMAATEWHYEGKDTPDRRYLVAARAVLFRLPLFGRKVVELN